MLKAQVQPKVVQERLGHSTIATTMDIYPYVLREMDIAVAEAFDRQFDDFGYQERDSGLSNGQFSFESQRSSVVEQRFRKPQVGGSNPPVGSIF